MTLVRPAVLADASAMGHVMVVSWLDAHRGQMPDRLWEARARDWTADVSAAGWTRVLGEIERGERPAGTLLVADAGGDMVGIGMITARADVGDVDALYVHPARRTQRIGTRLLAALAAALPDDCTTVELSVLAANAPARRFYERVGGALVGRSSTWEGDTELPEVVYSWDREHLVALDDR